MAVCGVCGREKAPTDVLRSLMFGSAVAIPRGFEQCCLGPSADCFKTGYSRAIVALANVSGALVDAATIPVPEPAQYGNAVRMLSAERDEAVRLLRDVLRIGYGTVSSIRAFLAKHPEAG